LDASHNLLLCGIWVTYRKNTMVIGQIICQLLEMFEVK
jgi:hypothetical protein